MSEKSAGALQCIAVDVKLGRDVRLNAFVNLYGCSIGDDCMIGTFIEIQRDVAIGPRCRLQSHSFICSGVQIAADVFIGHGVIFIHDRNPSVAASMKGTWSLQRTIIETGVSIGSGALILASITIGAGARVGADAVVTRDVESNTTVAGIPALGTPGRR